MAQQSHRYTSDARSPPQRRWGRDKFELRRHFPVVGSPASNTAAERAAIVYQDRRARLPGTTRQWILESGQNAFCPAEAILVLCGWIGAKEQPGRYGQGNEDVAIENIRPTYDTRLVLLFLTKRRTDGMLAG